MISDFVAGHWAQWAFVPRLRGPWGLMAIGLVCALTLGIAAPAGGGPSDGARDDCGQDHPCIRSYVLTSWSARPAFGILLRAPRDGCRHVRYVLRDDRQHRLGQTPALGPGERAVVRVGRGFAPGDHRLSIIALGCNRTPIEARRVVLAKLSVSHGWRAP